MQSFGWKKKHGKTHLSCKPANSFVESGDNDELDDPSIDWLTAVKTPSVLHLEDANIKFQRLVNEGIMLTENEKWWQAIRIWSSALTYSPSEYKVHDMLAQAYMQVGEVFPAVKSAKAATVLVPNWWQGFQTYGRALLGLGEVAVAIKAFSKAIHLQPDQTELWHDDLQWAIGIIHEHNNLEKVIKEKENGEERKREEERRNCDLIIREITDEDEMAENVKVERVPVCHPPITSTSRKRKIEDLESDPRFVKPVSLYNYPGMIHETRRSEMDPRNMVCYRQ